MGGGGGLIMYCPPYFVFENNRKSKFLGTFFLHGITKFGNLQGCLLALSPLIPNFGCEKNL